MKKRVYIIILLLLCMVNGVRSQQENQEPVFVYHNKIKVTTITLKQRDKDLNIRLRLEPNGATFRECEAVMLTPVLVSPSGRSMSLPPVLVNGLNEHKAYMRSQALLRKKNIDTDLIETLAGKKVDYRQKVRYKPWMADARLDVVAQVSGCGSVWADAGEGNLQDSLSLQRDINPYRMNFRYSYLLPGKKSGSENPMISNAYLEFPVNRTEIRYDFSNNAAELEKVNYMIATAAAYTDISVKGIEITGYASPEGPTDNNDHLARGRAEAMRSYLTGRDKKIDAKLYHVSDGGEDWKGLAELIQKTPRFSENARLREIIALPDTETRKRELQLLDNGSLYPQLLSELYPQLRRVNCRVDFEWQEDGDGDQIGEITGKPTDLSLDQMYQMALNYPRGSEAFNDVLESAAKAYERNPVANLNAASAALTRGDLNAAERFLKRTDRKLPEYANLAGVLELLRENYTAGEKLLRRAAQAGLPEAAHNLEELRKKLDNIKAIKMNK